MSFIARKVDDKRYLLVDFEGDVTISELEESRAAIKNLLQESGKFKEILVDMQKASLAVSTNDIHQFVSAHRDVLPPGCLIAVIVHPNDWATALFAETVAYNRGIYMRVFQNNLHAYAWLGITDRK
jgi:hypothetical protein